MGPCSDYAMESGHHMHIHKNNSFNHGKGSTHGYAQVIGAVLCGYLYEQKSSYDVDGIMRMEPGEKRTHSR